MGGEGERGEEVVMGSGMRVGRERVGCEGKRVEW